MNWLILRSVMDQMEAARAANYLPTPAQQESFDAMSASMNDTTRIMSVAGGSATISVSGVLTDAPDIIAKIFGSGNTTYREIINAIVAADSDPDVKEIIVDINSAGGQATADQQDAFAALSAASKPTVARVGRMAASAAFGLAVQADKVVAQNVMSMVGSVGVVVSAFVSDRVVQVTSTNAPKKRVDPTTEAGKAVIREWIDQIETIFIDSIASGRGVSAQTVKNDFGQGGIVLSEEAIKRNMIDSIATDGGQSAANVAEAKTQTAVGGKKQESPMDLVTLKASHPAVYLAAFDEGKTKGAEDEKDRVSAHLTYGQECGCMDIASKAIEDGSPVTNTLLAKYLTAGRNKKDVDTRSQDEIDAAAAADGAKTPKLDTEEQAAAEEKVVDEALKLAGMSVEDEEAK